MPELRYFTAGESHGQCLIGVVEGLPAGLKLDRAAINRDLARRQQGYGRGGRMKIEADEAEIVSGVRVIKSFAQEKNQTQQFNVHSDKFTQACDRVARWDSLNRVPAGAGAWLAMFSVSILIVQS